MKIYTKTGDKGSTSLVDGTRVAKNHPQIEAYASVDELNSFIGLFCSELILSKLDSSFKNSCLQLQQNIQSLLFQIGSSLASSKDSDAKDFLKIFPEDIASLEQKIDEITAQVPELKNFILPGGTKLASLCHILRTHTRRAERNVVALNRDVYEVAIIYLNRLSDFYFCLARQMNFLEESSDILWQPRK